MNETILTTFASHLFLQTTAQQKKLLVIAIKKLEPLA